MNNKDLIIGKKALIDAANQHRLVKAIISKKDPHLTAAILNSSCEIEYNENETFYDRLTNNANHQYAVGYVKNDSKITNLKQYLLSSVDIKTQLIILLDSIEDPHNFGAIIRSAEALGACAIVYKKNNQCPVNETVIKVSAGASSNINLIEVVNLNETIKLLKDNGFWIYASCLETDAVDASEIAYDKKTALILGNEKDGISKLIIKNSDFKVYIPMFGKTQSLNVSVAAGILIQLIIKSQKLIK